MSWLGLLAVAAALAGLAFLYAYPRLRRPPLVERDVVGRVVDKSLTLHESQTGTTAGLKLLVEDADGRRSEVRVTPEQYERARVGMWVERRGGEIREIRLPPGGPRPSPAAERGGRVEER